MAQYDSSRTHLVAQNGSNFLVRGSVPITDSSFAYQKLKEDIGNLIKVDNFNLENFELVDLSLIDHTGERSMLEIEWKAYGLDPNTIPSPQRAPFDEEYQPSLQGNDCLGHPGKFVWYPIEGVGGAMSYNDAVNIIIKGGYNFDGCVDMLNELFTAETTTPRVIYFHCTLGADRTGALAFGYLHKHGGMSPEEAKQKVNEVTTPNLDYQRLEDMYTKYLANKRV